MEGGRRTGVVLREVGKRFLHRDVATMEDDIPVPSGCSEGGKNMYCLGNSIARVKATNRAKKDCLRIGVMEEVSGGIREHVK